MNIYIYIQLSTHSGLKWFECHFQHVPFCFPRVGGVSNEWFLDGRKPGSVAWDLAAGGSWGSQTGERTRLVMILDASMRGVFCLYQIPKENPS